MSHLLLQDGGALLLQDGGFILLDAETAAPSATTHGGSTFDPSPQTRAYWESEGQRLAVMRDDEEVLLL